MSLTELDKMTVRSLWNKIGKSADVIGAEALGRMFMVYPQSKIYFSHWPDLRPQSHVVKLHGKRIMSGIGLAVTKIDDLTNGLLALSEQHAFKLRVDPSNFKGLSHCLFVSIAMMFPDELTEEAHCTLDKFMNALCLALAERYR